MSTREEQLAAGRREAEDDWKVCAVNIRTLQSDGAFAQGYRARRQELRRAERVELGGAS